jgi:glycosyltransferase involved in cell wall biosynthesis
MTVRPLRILAVVPSLGVGGAERVLTTLAELWAASGHTVLIATLGDEPNHAFVPSPLVDVVSLRVAGTSSSRWQGLINNMKRARAIAEVIADWRPSVAIGFTTHASVLTAYAAAREGVPCIVTERNFPPSNPIGTGWAILRRGAYRRASVIAMQTERAARWARARWDPKRVVVVPNPLAGDLLRTPTREGRATTVTFLGRLAPVKRPLDAIAAFAAATVPPWRLQMIGDGPLRSAGETLAASLGVADRVDWLGIRGDIGDLLRSSTIALFTSSTEGFPNGLLEAMAAGCAVVSTDCPAGPAELLRTDECGLLAPVGETQMIAAALRRLIEDPQLCARLGRAARARALEFAPVLVGCQWEAVLQRTVP